MAIVRAALHCPALGKLHGSGASTGQRAVLGARLARIRRFGSVLVLAEFGHRHLVSGRSRLIGDGFVCSLEPDVDGAESRSGRLELLDMAQSSEMPSFASDEEADAWLRSSSPFYDRMARDLDGRGGYAFRRGDRPRGMVVHENGNRYIELNTDLKGAERVSILIFELTNAFQDTKHIEIDQRARSGVIENAELFALRHELIEYDGLRYHRSVLAELEKVVGGIPREMLGWINPALTTLESYRLPLAHDYLESQNRSGHTDHYRRHFPISDRRLRKPEQEASERRPSDPVSS